jgi:23S rRNA (cytosine1962-C5)-methyltransferase
LKRVILKPGEEKRILAGHPWVYDNEVERVLSGSFAGPGAAPEAALESGETADVESSRKTYLGRAFVNPRSKIIARIYSPSKEGADKGFFKRRIREAVARRVTAGYDLERESARLVFAEADFLPGLIVDRFVGWALTDLEAADHKNGIERKTEFCAVSERPLNFDAALAAFGAPRSWLAVQFLTYGVEVRREDILAALEEVLAPALPETLGPPAGIIEKSTARVRELEGLPLREGVIRGSFPPGGIVLFENGFPFAVNLEEGQKTGHFLDQRDNRRLAAAYAGSGARVLDACAYTGGFGIHACRAGAASAIAADVSAAALSLTRKNAALNGVEDRITTVEADIFDLLPRYERAKERFDLIILDPPAFAKTRSALEGAVRGYKEINLRAIKLLNPGGVLVSCSCSQAMDESRFKRMITEAAADADRRLMQLDFRYQAADHPILLGYGESQYLKCGMYRVVG